MDKERPELSYEESGDAAVQFMKDMRATPRAKGESREHAYKKCYRENKQEAEARGLKGNPHGHFARKGIKLSWPVYLPWP
jgi:hypothetical protein